MHKNPFILFTLVIPLFALGCKKAPASASKESPDDSLHFVAQSLVTSVIRGEAPSLFTENKTIHLSFASGDSIYYSCSTDTGRTFTTPEFVAAIRGLVNAGGRGPQIVSSNGRLLIAAPDRSGNFFTYSKANKESHWIKGPRINDLANVAKEGFISLAANNNGLLFAVWLDLRKGGRNNLFGAGSTDGGATWLKNNLIYQSPDGSICECCKPSLAMKDLQIAVMFRNNVKGNRDLYLTQSLDGGASFDTARKLGVESWKINGCPMDGGGIIIDDKNTVETVWRREENIYKSRPGLKEELLNAGMRCTIDGLNGLDYIAYVNKGRVFCRMPDGKTIELGPGIGYPKLKALDKSTLLCVWENDKKIYRTLIF
jgi:hypothetical protein